MKQTNDSSLRNEILKWWNGLGIKKAECLGNKYFHRDYGIVAIDDTTDDEIKYIYQQETKPTAIIGSGVEEKISYDKYDEHFSFFGFTDHVDYDLRIEFSDHIKEDEAIEISDKICEAVNNYQSLRESNAALIEYNSELLDIVKGLSIKFYNELQKMKMPDGKTNMYPIILSSIRKAKNI